VPISGCFIEGSGSGEDYLFILFSAIGCVGD
jgi:hypothetical protein